MGCCYSRVEREEMVSRCKARKRYMKQFVKARQALSSSHTMYLRSLRSTGSALLQFANAETTLHHHHRHHLPPLSPSPSSRPHTPLPPPPPPPLSSSTDTWTTTTNSVTASPLPPPPPPPITQQTWDFWDPFVASSSRSVTEEEWEMATVVTASVAAPPSVVSGFSKESCSDLAVVVSRNSKDLVEIVKEIDDYFLMASDAGAQLSLLLEVPTPTFTNHISAGKVYNYGRSLSPLTWIKGSNSKLNGFGKLDEEIDLAGGGIVRTSHCCTAERLYAWEKKLYLEVKNAEITKKEHEKKVGLLRKLEMKRNDYVKTEKIKKEVEKFESIMMVATQAIETTSIEVIKLRESELYPQLIDLVKGFMCMWRSMYECHQVQTQIVSQLKYLNTIPSTQPTSEIHRQSTLQLELEVQQWHISFCNIVNAHKNYIQSLTGWLRLSLFQFTKNPLTKTTQESKIYSLCEEWHLAIDRVPDKVASEGIKSFLTIIHTIVLQQTEEQKQKKRSDHAFKELEKKSAKLKSLENKYGPYSMVGASSTKSRAMIAEIRAKVEILQARAEEEKARYEKAISVTRAMTLNNLQMGFPHVFQAITGFSSVCVRAFESVYNQAKNTLDMHNIKMILPQERATSSISSRQS